MRSSRSRSIDARAGRGGSVLSSSRLAAACLATSQGPTSVPLPTRVGVVPCGGLASGNPERALAGAARRAPDPKAVREYETCSLESSALRLWRVRGESEDRASNEELSAEITDTYGASRAARLAVLGDGGSGAALEAPAAGSSGRLTPRTGSLAASDSHRVRHGHATRVGVVLGVRRDVRLREGCAWQMAERGRAAVRSGSVWSTPNRARRRPTSSHCQRTYPEGGHE